MHFVTGGAYNGKSQWVRTFYKLDEHTSCRWFSAYKGDILPEVLPDTQVVVLEGIEQWIYIAGKSFSRTTGKAWLDSWMDWENEGNRKVILIGTDLSKGIVPMEREVRQWRDLTGWFYQDAVKSCERFDWIWYGVAKRLK